MNKQRTYPLWLGALALAFVVWVFIPAPAQGQAPKSFSPFGWLTSAANLSSSFNNSAQIAEKGPRWVLQQVAGAGSAASVTKSAGGAGVRHVADCIGFSAAATTAPALTAEYVSLADGGTPVWAMEIAVSATTGQLVAPFAVCGLNIVGSANAAMVLAFNGGIANVVENVSLTGYDVQ